MIFRAWPLRFEFDADLAGRNTANALRGALGMHLGSSVFSPRGQGPSGLRDQPRPFVLRVAEGQGKRLTVQVNSFRADLFDAFRSAFRSAVRLVHAAEDAEVAIDLAQFARKTSALQIRFLTPMELKFEERLLREPRFDAIFARARDRVSALCGLYQGGAPEVDYRALGDRARAIEMTNFEITEVAVERRSSRTGQRHGLGGFVGWAEYKGDLGEFIPWLKAAEWTGVGRYTVWGNGELRATDISGDNVALERNTGGGPDAVIADFEA